METIVGNNRYINKNSKTTESFSHLKERFALHLSRWNGLQMAVQNQWVGLDSVQKSHHLAADILSWFSQSKPQLHVEDMETLLDESMLLSFNTQIEDGSIEEVAEQLMIMHEEYLHGTQTIKKPGKAES